MMVYFLMLIYVLSSSMIQSEKMKQTNEKILDKYFEIQGHQLDCQNRCKICLDYSSFEDSVKSYAEKNKKLPTEQEVKDLLRVKSQELVMKNRVKSESDLIDEEVAKKEDKLNEELQEAVGILTKEGGNEDDIKEKAIGIKNRLLAKYRKEATNKLKKAHRIQEDPTASVKTATTTTSSTTKSKDTTADSDSSKEASKEDSSAIKTIETSTKTITKEPTKTKKNAQDKELYRVYFHFCIVDKIEKIFYSWPVSDY